MSRYLIAVVGHHRGGTSAVAGALTKMGFFAGPDEVLMPPSPDNPKGYFENMRLVAEHDGLLRALDRAWDDNRPLPEGWTSRIPYVQAKKAIRAELRKLAEVGDVVVKDPRLARLLPLYRDVALAEGMALRALVVYRDLKAVSASIVKRDAWDENKACEFVCQQKAYLREWDYGASIFFPNFMVTPELDLVGAVRRLRPGPCVYDPRVLREFLDPNLVHHG